MFAIGKFGCSPNTFLGGAVLMCFASIPLLRKQCPQKLASSFVENGTILHQLNAVNMRDVSCSKAVSMLSNFEVDNTLIEIVYLDEKA